MSEPFPYHEQPEGLRLSPSLGLDDDREARLRDYAWREIVMGQLDAEDFCEDVAYDPELEDLDLDLDDEVLTEAFGELLAARHAQQQTWPQEVRETALARAFADLAEIGVLARENLSDPCGAYEEIYEELDDTRVWRGYVYFHGQDTATLVSTRRTHLTCDVFRNPHPWCMTKDEWNALSREEQKATSDRLVDSLVREEVIPVLERHGITVEWDGDRNTRILLKDLDWYAEVTAEDAHGQP